MEFGGKALGEGHPAVDRADVGLPIGKRNVDEAFGWNRIAGEVGGDEPGLERGAVEEFLQDAGSVIGTLAVAGNDDAGRSVDGLEKPEEGPPHI